MTARPLAPHDWYPPDRPDELCTCMRCWTISHDPEEKTRETGEREYDCRLLLRERADAMLALLADYDHHARATRHGCMHCAGGPVEEETNWKHAEDCPLGEALAWRTP